VRKLQSTVGYVLCWSAAILVIVVCFGMIAYLLQQGFRALSWSFLTTDPNPSLTAETPQGIRVPIVGTFILAIGGTLVMLLPALGSAIYLSEYMREEWPLTRAIRLGLEVLAGVPSVVFGMFGLAFFSLPVFGFLSSKTDEAATTAFGRSFMIGAVVFAVHVLPFVVKVMEEAIRSVPQSYRLGAAALGMTKWRTTRKVVLPSALPGLVTAIVLGLGLIIGDTAIVWLTVGGSMTMSGSEQWWNPANWLAVLVGTGSTLTTFIYYNSPAGEGNAPEQAYAAAFVLICIVVVLNVAIAWIGRSRHLKGA